MTALTRSTQNIKFKVLAGSDTSEAVDLSSVAWGSVQFPAAIDGGSFRYWASNDSSRSAERLSANIYIPRVMRTALFS